MREARDPLGARIGAAGARSSGLPRERIVISCKVSQVQDLIAVYRELAARCDYALHLGLTEAGMGSKGIVASTAAMARAAAGRHRRHHPRLAHARARRRPHARSASSRRRSCRPWACARSRRWSAPARAAGAPPAPYFQELADKIQTLPARRRCRSGRALPRRRGHARRGDGLRGERPGRIEARQHRHQPAGHRRECRWRRSTSTARRP